MTTARGIRWFTIFAMVAGALLMGGCATQRTLPPLFTTAPRQDSPDALELLDVPVAPASATVPLVIRLPRRDAKVLDENHIMRRDAVVKPGSSVVISVPDSIYQQSQSKPDKVLGNPDAIGFRTDGYFNIVEQYIERGLIAIGLNVKDRSKFEAKLRDLRDNTKDDSYAIALADLQKALAAGELTRDQFAKQADELREKLQDSKGMSMDGRKEMKDISEVIRAAQNGDVMADFILQVNAAAVEPYNGAPLKLGLLPETQKVLRENPGLRLGEAGEKGCIPSEIKQPWAQARFNAKLIDVKTGSIDWIGEFSIDSLAVLKDGVQIGINIRKRTANANLIIGAVEDYNRKADAAHQKAAAAKRELDAAYDGALKPVTYRPVNPSCILPIFSQSAGEDANHQARRREKVAQCEAAYESALAAYRSALQDEPAEANMDWTFDYDVDVPIVVPDLFRARTEEEIRKLEEHVRALGSKVTRDLLETIKISDDKAK